MAAQNPDEWIDTCKEHISSLRNDCLWANYGRQNCIFIKSQCMPYLPSAIRMFKILQALKFRHVVVFEKRGPKYVNDQHYHMSYTALYNTQSLTEFIQFKFETESACADFERSIIREMGDHIDGQLPPPYAAVGEAK